MDKEISKQSLWKSSKRPLLYVAVSVALLAAASWLLRDALGNNVKRSAIRTAVVETGDVEHTLSAGGEVQPQLELVITSPMAAVIRNVFYSAGAQLETGQKILELDKTDAQTAYDKQKDELELKRNGIVKLQLALDKSFYDIKIQDSIKAYRISGLLADVENAKRLFAAGGGTREAIEKAETELRIARLEKRQLENDIRSRQQAMQADIRESQIEALIQEKALGDMDRKLRQTDITAPRAGALTFINSNLGLKVNEGEILARIADLGSFKLIGSISDNYAAQLRLGMPVVARIDETLVRGRLVNIQPAVSNNTVLFDVALDDASVNDRLRPRMKLDVYVIVGARAQTKRVANGPAFRDVPEQDVFVVRPDGVAERRRIKTGLSSFDYVEILEGLNEGETVIVSDMSMYKNAKEVKIK